MRSAGVVTAVVALAAGLALTAPGFLTRERDYASVTPQPPALASPTTVRVAGDDRACMNLVAVDEYSEQARIRPTTPGRAPMPLRITIDGPGYAARGTVDDYRDGEVVAIDVPAPRASLQVVACVHNLGRRPVDLAAVYDRGRSRSGVFANGKPSPAAFELSFYERRPATILDRLPVSLRRMSVLRPAPVVPATLWPVLVLFVVGVPGAAIWAFARAARQDAA
jgi:hypothetical protein